MKPSAKNGNENNVKQVYRMFWCRRFHARILSCSKFLAVWIEDKIEQEKNDCFPPERLDSVHLVKQVINLIHLSNLVYKLFFHGIHDFL
jgi:hypothetical protein